MPIVIVNASADRPVATDGAPLDGRFLAQLAALPQNAPIIIMLHGYRYTPRDEGRSPHSHILASSDQARLTRRLSWPRRMGFGQGRTDEGLCICFGWEATGSLWRAYDEAARAGLALADLIALIRATRQGPVHVMAHSLGARVALAALPHLPERAVDRMIVLAAAEFCGPADAALASPAGRTAEVLNITSRENDLFDFLFERLLAPFAGRAETMAKGLARPNCLTVQLDAADHRRGLHRLGFPTAPALRRICHWSGYMRPGVFPFYRAFLRRPDTLPLGLLRAHLPGTVTPRWSRLLPLPRFPLPRLRKWSS